ncbi:hypothetical protein Sj15T_10780 [Sphingobium sp. TA15]|uniref:hypothetical protein n=1 Tax=Sphingobium TaxID=165695 RepID=UPI0012B5B895|nr:hypothetical protein [Sphingobium indicum]BDD66057.1 hypothetical protein Sj15T_10780 [Sphingobium sp. TA15]
MAVVAPPDGIAVNARLERAAPSIAQATPKRVPRNWLSRINTGMPRTIPSMKHSMIVG